MTDDVKENEHRIRRRSGYTSIPNAAMSDTRLSIEARGLLALLMGFSSGWVFRASHLMKQCNVGRDKYYRMLGELKAVGYVHIIKTHGEDGKFVGTEWEICDDPCPENPYPENTSAGKTAHLSINNSVSINNYKTPIPPKGDQDLFQENDETIEEHSSFDDFWKAYPKKTGKAAARKAWDKAIKTHNATEIIEGAQRYADWLSNAPNGEFRPHAKHPQGWLNGRRWADEEIWQGAGAKSCHMRFEDLTEMQRKMFRAGTCPPSMMVDGKPNETAKRFLRMKQ